jgi:hypothetical protein
MKFHVWFIASMGRYVLTMERNLWQGRTVCAVVAFFSLAGAHAAAARAGHGAPTSSGLRPVTMPHDAVSPAVPPVVSASTHPVPAVDHALGPVLEQADTTGNTATDNSIKITKVARTISSHTRSQIESENLSSIPAVPPSKAVPSMPSPPVIDAVPLRAVAPAGDEGHGAGRSVLTASLVIALALIVFALLSSILPAVLPGRRGSTAREAMPKS